MGRPIIKILDAVHCKADKHARTLIKDCLAYNATAWKRNPFGGREEKVVKQFLISGREGTAGTFLTGLLPRVEKHCSEQGIKIIRRGKLEHLDVIVKHPKLKGITFRRDQRRVFRSVRMNQRGKIIFPTGSGKTVIAMGIMRMFPDCRILWLCHTTDLLQQTKEEFELYKFKGVHVMGGGYVADFNKLRKKDNVIVLSTIQTFKKLPVKSYSSFFDLTIVDEMHHVNERSSMYGMVMEHNLSPRRYGLTATEPTKQNEYLLNEGIFGRVIATLDMQEGIEAGIIAKPIINLIPVKYDVNLNQLCKGKYKHYYEKAIVESEHRNSLVVKAAISTARKGGICLIIIERTEHGLLLKEMFRAHKRRVPFVYGTTSRTRRTNVKKKLQTGKLNIAICSKVWREGINIPALTHVINAVGMKEEKMVLQALGRGLRTTKDKTTIELTDFLDPYKYLAEHTVLRLQTYIKEGWL